MSQPTRPGVELVSAADGKKPAADSFRCCAVVVTFFPGEDLESNLRAIAAECERVVVVDNGSGEDIGRRLQNVDGVELLALEKNHGVAAALNVGARRAIELGCDWMLTFDQDSRPEPGFLAA